ncbi:unnamed protein product [Diatraea saccharalis]|uniref:Uncharacterized protein n=1 Tax=Diatraea saccharalis TaxID=40085 RepID=A0A9N9RA08_9NEOP|nr:unnamed protein product [Diatraea saccharalis]
MDFSQICRVCLQSNKQMFDIYNSYTKNNILYCEMLSYCTKVKPSKEDALPQLLCKDCCRQLRRTYAFNKQCEDSDLKLKQCLDNLHSSKYGESGFICDTTENLKNNLELKPLNHIETTTHILGKVHNLKSKEETLSQLRIDIKTEPNYDVANDESFWMEDNGDDDEVTLPEKPKAKRKKDEEEEKPKKKRGRKKKVCPDGETSLPESKLPHQCDVCGKILSTKSNLKAHKICHTDLRPYKCTDCPATFRGHSALFQHKKVHTGETPYHCQYCPKQFSRRTGLVNHIRMHTGEKLYSCDICFKNFVQSAQLSIHMKRHKGDKSFLCQDCGKGFPIKSDLKVHQRIHNGEKPYACHLCTKTFATSGNLSIHVRIHNKEVRYNCKVCHRGFVTRSAYNVHVKRHKGQRDYHCECGKMFYTSSALKQHKVVHTGEKKYQCKICERKFTQTSHLSRHFKRDHMKPNAPVPSSDYYKTVLQEGSKVFNMLGDNVPKVDSGVKCENS